jgi:hypothetical protein
MTARHLPELTASVEEITIIGFNHGSYGAAACSADGGSDCDRAATGSHCRPDQGARSGSGDNTDEDIPLLVGHGSAARQEKCRTYGQNESPHTAPTIQTGIGRTRRQSSVVEFIENSR